MKIILERDHILEAVKEFINVRFNVDSRVDQMYWDCDFNELTITWDSNIKKED